MCPEIFLVFSGGFLLQTSKRCSYCSVYLWWKEQLYLKNPFLISNRKCIRSLPIQLKVSILSFSGNMVVTVRSFNLLSAEILQSIHLSSVKMHVARPLLWDCGLRDFHFDYLSLCLHLGLSFHMQLPSRWFPHWFPIRHQSYNMLHKLYLHDPFEHIQALIKEFMQLFLRVWLEWELWKPHRTNSSVLFGIKDNFLYRLFLLFVLFKAITK